MQEPRTSPSGPPGDSEPAQTPAPSATEVVTRPEPGLARGKWEAPAWAFWVVLALVLLASVAYVLRRLGRLSLRSDAKPDDALPPSSKARRP